MIIVDELVKIEIGPDGITAENLSDKHVRLSDATMPGFLEVITPLKPREKRGILSLVAYEYDPAEDEQGM